MLNQALDKLRDKTWSFGCIYKHQGRDSYGIRKYLGRGHDELNMEDDDEPNYYAMSLGGMLATYRIEPKNLDIIGHPLTWGRLQYVYRDVFHYLGVTEYDARKKIVELTSLFNSFYELYNQDETQRMKHEKRPELEKLLIEFANLLPDDSNEDKNFGRP